MAKGRKTINDVAKALRAYGLSMRKTEYGEYRVSFPHDEDGAYYANDLDDALNTGLAMYDSKLRRALGMTYARFGNA